eukprot:96962-Rhodomonas_salina.2
MGELAARTGAVPFRKVESMSSVVPRVRCVMSGADQGSDAASRTLCLRRWVLRLGGGGDGEEEEDEDEDEDEDEEDESEGEDAGGSTPPSDHRTSVLPDTGMSYDTPHSR